MIYVNTPTHLQTYDKCNTGITIIVTVRIVTASIHTSFVYVYVNTKACQLIYTITVAV